jgi:hypothetical protein
MNYEQLVVVLLVPSGIGEQYIARLFLVCIVQHFVVVAIFQEYEIYCDLVSVWALI